MPVIRNSGISFGIEIHWIFVVIFFVVLLWWYKKERSWPLLLVIIGGALNLWERLTLGYVRDYWRIPGTNIYNNFNDWLIFVGVIIYIWKKSK